MVFTSPKRASRGSRHNEDAIVACNRQAPRVNYRAVRILPPCRLRGDWAQQTLDAGNTPSEMFYRNYATPAPGQTESRWAEGQRLAGQLLKPGWTAADQFGGASELLTESLGSAMLARDVDTNASGNMTGMYGGPLWAALARTGDPDIMGLINQNFDPWFSSRTWDPAARQAHYAAERAAQGLTSYAPLTAEQQWYANMSTP